jgi:hypothetical protein
MLSMPRSACQVVLGGRSTTGSNGRGGVTLGKRGVCVCGGGGLGVYAWLWCPWSKQHQGLQARHRPVHVTRRQGAHCFGLQGLSVLQLLHKARAGAWLSWTERCYVHLYSMLLYALGCTGSFWPVPAVKPGHVGGVRSFSVLYMCATLRRRRGLSDCRGCCCSALHRPCLCVESQPAWSGQSPPAAAAVLDCSTHQAAPP